MLDLLLLTTTIIVLTFCWKSMFLATGLLALLTVIRWRIKFNKTDFIVYIFGFVFGSLAEIVQVASGLYTYQQHTLVVIPYYNFFLWGAVLLGSKTIISKLEELLSAKLPSVSLKTVIIEQCVYIGITLVLCTASGYQTWVAGLFGCALLLRMMLFYGKKDAVFVIVGMLLGPLTESWLVHLGIYRFNEPRIGNLPLWHPLYWGLIILFLRRFFYLLDFFRATKVSLSGLETQ